MAYDFFPIERLHIAEDGHRRATRGPKALEVPVEYFFETEVSDGKRDKIKLLTELAGQLTENQIDVIINMIRGLTRENL